MTLLQHTYPANLQARTLRFKHAALQKMSETAAAPCQLTHTYICSEYRQTGGRTVAGAGALPGVLRGDVSSSGGGEMAQPLSRQPHGVPAASRWASAAQTAVVTHSEDAEA